MNLKSDRQFNIIPPHAGLRGHVLFYNILCSGPALFPAQYTLMPNACGTLSFAFDGDRLLAELWGASVAPTVLGAEPNRYRVLALVQFPPHGLYQLTRQSQAEFAQSTLGEVGLQKCKKSEVIYPYNVKEKALPLFEVVRIQYTDGSKSFRQRRMAEDGRYVYNMQGVQPVLYRLPSLAKAIQKGAAVYVCEGEKDADALNALGYTATTSPMGAGKWREEYTKSLNGAQIVYLLPDNDKPGRAHALAVAKSLLAAGIPASVVDLRSVWAGLPPKGDIFDVLQEAGPGVAAEFPKHAVSPAEFEEIAAQRELMETAPPYRFASAAVYLAENFARELAKSAGTSGLSTGFSQLDKQLNGRLYPGLYVVGSVSSLGKTAFLFANGRCHCGPGPGCVVFHAGDEPFGDGGPQPHPPFV